MTHSERLAVGGSLSQPYRPTRRDNIAAVVISIAGAGALIGICTLGAFVRPW
jgi:hypothetical protein